MAGQIIKRGDRTWLVRVFLGRDAQTGKRQYHNQTVQGTKKGAEDKLVDLLKDRNAGRLTIGSTSLLTWCATIESTSRTWLGLRG